MKHQIILQRESEHKGVKKPNTEKLEDSTLGELSVYEVSEDGQKQRIFRCYTCENIGESTDTPNQDRRIVARDYQLEWTQSSKNGSLAKAYPQFKLQNGKNRAILLTCDEVMPAFRNRRILMHVGNYPHDTEGCILLGKAKGAGVVNASVEACKEFFETIERIGIEHCTLQVKEQKKEAKS